METILETWESIKDYIKNNQPEIFKFIDVVRFNEFTHKDEMVDVVSELVLHCHGCGDQKLERRVFLFLGDLRRL